MIYKNKTYQLAILRNFPQYVVSTKQYFSSTIARFCLRINHYKSNIMLYCEESRNFKQEKSIKHFFCDNHSGTHRDKIEV